MTAGSLPSTAWSTSRNPCERTRPACRWRFSRCRTTTSRCDASRAAPVRATRRATRPRPQAPIRAPRSWLRAGGRRCLSKPEPKSVARMSEATSGYGRRCATGISLPSCGLRSQARCEMKRARLFAIAAAVAIGIAGLAQPAKAQDKGGLRVDWVFGTEHSGIWVAQEKGFFKDENLDVRILPGEGSSVTVKLVGTGAVDFGYATADQAMLAYSRALPVVTTAVILQSSPTAIVFPKSTGIKKLTDLYGKRLGLQLKSAVERQWRVVAKNKPHRHQQDHRSPCRSRGGATDHCRTHRCGRCVLLQRRDSPHR